MFLHNALIYLVVSCFTRDGAASWSGKGCIPPAPSPSGFRGHQSVHFPPKTRHFRTETVHKPYIPVQFPYKLPTPESGREAAQLRQIGDRHQKAVHFRAKIDQMSSESRRKHPKWRQKYA